MIIDKERVVLAKKSAALAAVSLVAFVANDLIEVVVHNSTGMPLVEITAFVLLVIATVLGTRALMPVVREPSTEHLVAMIIVGSGFGVVALPFLMVREYVTTVVGVVYLIMGFTVIASTVLFDYR